MKEIIFLGVNDIVLAAAKWCHAHKISGKIVCTNKQLSSLTAEFPAIASELTAANFKLLTYSSAEDIDITFSSDSIAISVGAPWIFTKKALAKLPSSIFNLHGSHLPRMRGGTLFSWLILTGQRTGMALLHKLSEGIDDGPIIKFEEFIYTSDCKKPIDFIRIYNKQNLELLLDFLREWSESESFRENNYRAAIQPSYLSTYWPRLSAPHHGWINWEWNADEIEKFITAFDEPYAGARTLMREKTVILKDTYWQRSDGFTHPFQSGIVYRKTKKWIHVAAVGGELIVCEVLDESGVDIMSKISAGDRFYTPGDILNNAKQRVVKKESGFQWQSNF